MDEKTVQKKQRKFNFVDIIILLIIIAVAGVFVGNYAIRPGSVADSSQKTYQFTMTLDNLEVPNENFENGKISVGDMLIERNGYKLGKIISIEAKLERNFAVNTEGERVLSPRPGYSHLILTIEGTGSRPPDGGLMVSGLHIYQNKFFEINIKDSAFNLRVTGFTVKEGG